MNKEPNFEGEKMKLPTQKLTSSFKKINESQNNGAIIAVLAIILIAILIGIFYWYKSGTQIITTSESPTRPTLETNKEPETTTATAQVESFTVMSTSDELNAIEADIESTNLDSLETELQQIETELQTAVR